MARNPLELKRKTHVLARAHLRRFTFDEKKSRLFVYNKRTSRVQSVQVDVDGLFNVNGVWSHQAENLMGRIEGAFWDLLGELDSSGKIPRQDVISEYFALWYARAYYSENHQDFTGPLVGVTPSDLKGTVEISKGKDVVTVTQEELLEYRHCGFYSTDLVASARSASWPIIRVLMDRCLLRLQAIRWGIVECEEQPLVLPDRLTYFDVPVGPQRILHGFTPREKYRPHAFVGRVDVEDWNRGFFKGARYAVAAQSRDVLDNLARELSDKQ